MRYPPEAIERFHQEHPRVERELLKVYGGAVVFAQERLANADAKKYMLHGVARRLGFIRRCANRIFESFPPSQITPLDRETLEDINIHLHAFILHGNALQDNLAWVYVKEFEVDVGRHDVSLFKNRLKRLLPQPVRDYLDNEQIQRWHAAYSTDFRDALAHRIPLYVPPAQLTPADAQRAGELQAIFNERVQAHDWEAVIAAQDEMNSLGLACPYFLQEFGGNQIILHPQILCDALTAVELYTTVTENWAAPMSST